MMTTQLLSAYDDMAGGASGRPVPVAALLAHLLFLREVGGLARPTALTDTFGTSAFIQVGPPHSTGGWYGSRPRCCSLRHALS